MTIGLTEPLVKMYTKWNFSVVWESWINFSPLFFILHSSEFFFASRKRRCQNNPRRLCSLSGSEKFRKFSESGCSPKISSIRALTRMTLETHFPHLWNSEKFQVSIQDKILNGSKMKSPSQFCLSEMGLSFLFFASKWLSKLHLLWFSLIVCNLSSSVSCLCLSCITCRLLVSLHNFSNEFPKLILAF